MSNQSCEDLTGESTSSIDKKAYYKDESMLQLITPSSNIKNYIPLISEISNLESEEAKKFVQMYIEQGSNKNPVGKVSLELKCTIKTRL